MSGRLDEMVTAVAAELMGGTAVNAAAVSERVLADLTKRLSVDVCFLRYNDHDIRATRLIAEWPPREPVQPDPIGLVYFADADPIFARAEYLKEPDVLRPEPANADYQRRIEEGTAVPETSLACVPLLSGDLTTGTLGFVKFGDREWLPEELTALQAVATLFAQLQARITAEEKLHYLAEHDDLTGLVNRSALIGHLDARLAAGRPGPVAVLFFDLDRLKAVNDYLGHGAGDAFLVSFANRLVAQAGPDAICARLGGDEFVVVPAEPMTLEEAHDFGRRMRVDLHSPEVIAGETLMRTVSIGVAAGEPGSGVSSSDLLRRADQALLTAKKGGGNNAAAFSVDLERAFDLRHDVELHLGEVIQHDPGALVVHYLPEVDMRTGEIVATEALVRWQHPTRGLLLPGAFIGIAESINLAGELGRLVMRAACREFSGWLADGMPPDVVLNVNVSPVQLVTDGFVDTVASTLDEFGLDGSMICLEITESVVVQDGDASRITLNGLKDVGVRIAIDDFGTGYSVLSHLKNLPVDILKIDKGFVLELGENDSDFAIVRATVALADSFGLDVVAEGVETPAAALTLLELGCHRAQGYLFSRPVDGPAMRRLLANGQLPLDFSTPAERHRAQLKGGRRRWLPRRVLRAPHF
ncbi:bifunctional diguanylate cyclase/phosphodiesterase [Mycolicibacterium madagascariense]|uniref:Bifunctional diguanylate cyclase/phosphodiesterase n=1 Tax=Mycolicibacterium madagascariense TaxID=212765 RepID=A0A7I7XLM1_9MYCO|nr:EAL domain-containing protein [Mycolicibacterium madagascariense]MCV7012461.1 EAL domain-containing protein [Mycolicibacterium madagascariense]BBZ30138.1 bifunctional diguanylate cyclase/phosphodiesterase [Mycolicibacterium madagascariense]